MGQIWVDFGEILSIFNRHMGGGFSQHLNFATPYDVLLIVAAGAYFRLLSLAFVYSRLLSLALVHFRLLSLTFASCSHVFACFL